jgi:hypothetical protein
MKTFETRHPRRHDIQGNGNYTIPAIRHGDTTHANQGKWLLREP